MAAGSIPAGRTIFTTNRGKLMKNVLIALSLAILLSGCYKHTTPPGMESVIVDNPYIFGHGGVRDETQKPGLSWYWMSTHVEDIVMSPIKIDEPLTHLATADNNFINYASYIVLQWHNPAQTVRKFGYSKWYEHNLMEQYRTIVRDVTKEYQMTPIMISQATLKEIEDKIAERFRAHIKTTGLDVSLINVNMGKALPDKAVVEEMNNTAVQQQRVKTEGQRKLAEDSRKMAEQSRAAADNAYRENMKLDPQQFVQLEAIKAYSAACLKGGCVIVQGSTPVLVNGK